MIFNRRYLNIGYNHSDICAQCTKSSVFKRTRHAEHMVRIEVVYIVWCVFLLEFPLFSNAFRKQENGLFSKWIWMDVLTAEFLFLVDLFTLNVPLSKMGDLYLLLNDL